jgi:hypothetical protein
MKAMNRKSKRMAEFRSRIAENNLLNRFIRDIEREEPMDRELLQTIPVLIPVRNR